MELNEAAAAVQSLTEQLADRERDILRYEDQVLLFFPVIYSA